MLRITTTAADRLTAVCAGVQAALLLGYAASIGWVALASGIAGPQEVSSPTGVAVEVVTFALLGVGVAAVAVGRWRGSAWSTVPFVVTQALGLAVGVPLVTGAGGGVPAGAAICAAALIGLGALTVGAAQRNRTGQAGV